MTLAPKSRFRAELSDFPRPSSTKPVHRLYAPRLCGAHINLRLRLIDGLPQRLKRIGEHPNSQVHLLSTKEPGTNIRIVKISEGTVIDHIRAGKALDVLKILGITGKEGTVVTLAMNISSSKIERKDIRVALAGNPNVGKTTIFNEITGEKQHVGNFPGVTVEKVSGRKKYKGHVMEFVDLPGTYSLTAYSTDEIVARDYVINEKPDVVVQVVDATNIERKPIPTMNHP